MGWFGQVGQKGLVRLRSGIQFKLVEDYTGLVNLGYTILDRERDDKMEREREINDKIERERERNQIQN